MPSRENEPVVINTIANWTDTPNLPIATKSDEKLREIEAITGRPAVIAERTDIPEIQDTRWLPVAAANAEDAYLLNEQPVLIEESSFDIHDLQGTDGAPYPGALVKYILGSREQRAMHVAEAVKLAAERGGAQPRATSRSVLGAWDGQNFIYREGLTHGTLVMPIGDFNFGFDDIFVPDGQEDLPTWDPAVGYRTFAQMTLAEKNMLSARNKALKKLRDQPIEIGKKVFMTVEPDDLETEFARPEELADPKAINHAFRMDAVLGNEPNPQYEALHYQPFHVQRFRGGVTRVVARPDSHDNGIITSGLDTQLDERGRSKKLASEVDSSPVYYQFGPRQRQRSMLARADEFMRYHVDTAPPEEGKEPPTEPIAYGLVRQFMDGEIERVPKANRPSLVVEELLGVLRDQKPIINPETGRADPELEMETGLRTLAMATFGEVGYERLRAEGIMSRKVNADYGLIFDPSGRGEPGSIFEVGYMPQGSFKDLLVTAALSYTRCGISRNGYLANPENQLALFRDVKEELEARGLPDDIFRLCLSKVGLAVGVEDPVEVERVVTEFAKMGGTEVRFYSTCNDQRRHTVPERVRQSRYGNRLSLYYMPIVNYGHAEELTHPNIRINRIGVGHGGGENCDSLGAGGAYTGLKLLYQMYLNPQFNDVMVGVEGGGTGVIALLPMVDFISKNKQAFGAVIECGGLYVMDRSGNVVQPYHGSASVFTQLYEAAMYPQTAGRRISRAGIVRNVEGVSNYARFKRSEPSVVNKLQRLRMYAGLMLADHGAHDINDLRRHVRDHGFNNIVAVSALSAYTATPHATNHS